MLQLFYSNPNRSFYVREITRKIDEQINSVRRELANLLSIGIISSSDTTNKRLYYEINQKYEYYKPLAVIFGGKTLEGEKSSIGNTEAKLFQTAGNVEVALLTGQFTRDEKAGVDVLVVGDLNQTKMAKIISELEAKEGKELRYVVMTPSELDYRLRIKDRFMAQIMSAKKQILVDKHGLCNEDKQEETEE